MSKITWNEENTATVAKLAGDITVEVSVARLAEIAAEMNGTPRSVGAKLRKMEYSVQKAADAAKPTWTEDEAADLQEFVLANSGEYTYAELEGLVLNGKFTNKQIQGKILSLELTDNVKAAEKRVTPKSYTDAEEARIVELAAGGKFMEEIAEDLGKSLKSIRGKSLSMSRTIEGFEIPKQRDHVQTSRADALEGVDIANLTAAEIALEVNKTERGVKQMLTRRKLDCADHKGAAKAAKNEAKAD